MGQFKMFTAERCLDMPHDDLLPLFQLRVSSSKNSDDTTTPGMTLPGIVSYHEYGALLD